MSVRDRILDFRRVPAGELVVHPRNWREHPPQQAAALEGVLAEIGYADALLVRQRSDGRLEIIDGHLRAAITPQQLVPVLLLDVTAEEADKILLTHDPLAALATANGPLLAELIASVDFDSEAVRTMLAGLTESLITVRKPDSVTQTDSSSLLERSFQVAIECTDESQQEQLFRRLTHEGYTCRLLTM